MRYGIQFTKKVYGFFEVEANSEEEAVEKFNKDPNDFDEIENKSYYEFDEAIKL